MFYFGNLTSYIIESFLTPRLVKSTLARSFKNLTVRSQFGCRSGKKEFSERSLNCLLENAKKQKIEN